MSRRLAHGSGRAGDNPFPGKLLKVNIKARNRQKSVQETKKRARQHREIWKLVYTMGFVPTQIVNSVNKLK